MKKYFAIAALLGVFAFASVSLLAQAQPSSGAAAEKSMPAAAKPSADPSDGEAAADKEAMPAASGKQDAYEHDDDECTSQSLGVKGKDGAVASEEEVSAAYKSCMKAKHYTDEQLKAYEEGGAEDEGTGAPE